MALSPGLWVIGRSALPAGPAASPSWHSGRKASGLELALGADTRIRGRPWPILDWLRLLSVPGMVLPPPRLSAWPGLAVPLYGVVCPSCFVSFFVSMWLSLLIGYRLGVLGNKFA